METQYVYEPLTTREEGAAGSIVYGIMTNDRIVETITDFHTVGLRCAVVVVQKGGVLKEVVVREDRVVREHFPFDEIRDALATYNEKHNVCIVLVRDRGVCVVIGVRELDPF
jgi:hypothetical protein